MQYEVQYEYNKITIILNLHSITVNDNDNNNDGNNSKNNFQIYNLSGDVLEPEIFLFKTPITMEKVGNNFILKYNYFIIIINISI